MMRRLSALLLLAFGLVADSGCSFLSNSKHDSGSMNTTSVRGFTVVRDRERAELSIIGPNHQKVFLCQVFRSAFSYWSVDGRYIAVNDFPCAKVCGDVHVFKLDIARTGLTVTKVWCSEGVGTKTIPSSHAKWYVTAWSRTASGQNLQIRIVDAREIYESSTPHQKIVNLPFDFATDQRKLLKQPVPPATILIGEKETW